MATFLEANLLSGVEFYEPFAGSAGVGLNLLQQGFVSRLALIELDPLMGAFWIAATQYNDDLRRLIENCTVDLETWKKMRRLSERFKNVSTSLSEPRKIVAAGFAALFLNRTSFSGLLNSGPIGGFSQSSAYGLGCRFNKRRLDEQLENIGRVASRISIVHGCGLAFMRDRRRNFERSHNFFYVDPPYFSQGRRLYRSWFSSEQHRELASILSGSRFPWLLSYDRCEQTEELYRENNIAHVRFMYSAKVRRPEKEIMIASDDLVYPGEAELLRICRRHVANRTRLVETQNSEVLAELAET
jgi:DNA adenine methylase